MFTVVIGGSGSGKSAFAENLILSLGEKKRYYIATMEIYDDESRKRVEKHQKMRADKKFETIECPTQLENVEIQADSVVLLECMSNLVANEMFSENGRKINVDDVVINGVKRLLKTGLHIVIVTNSVFSDGCEYDEETMQYLRILGEVNTKMAAIADEVYEVICGIPIKIK